MACPDRRAQGRVVGSYIFFSQHLGGARNLILGGYCDPVSTTQNNTIPFPFPADKGRLTDDERNHARAIAAGSLKPLDELLDLPYLNLVGAGMSACESGRASMAHPLGGWVEQWRWQRNSHSSRPRWHWDRCSSWAKGAESKAGREGGDCRRVPLLSAEVREVCRWFCWGVRLFQQERGLRRGNSKWWGWTWGRGLQSNSFMLRRWSLGLVRWHGLGPEGGEWVRGTSAGESSLEAEPIRLLPTEEMTSGSQPRPVFVRDD